MQNMTKQKKLLMWWYDMKRTVRFRNVSQESWQMAARKLGPGKLFSTPVSTRPISAHGLSSSFFGAWRAKKKRGFSWSRGEGAQKWGKLGVHMGGNARKGACLFAWLHARMCRSKSGSCLVYLSLRSKPSEHLPYAKDNVRSNVRTKSLILSETKMPLRISVWNPEFYTTYLIFFSPSFSLTAKPKSPSLNSISALRKKLPTLISRCITRWACKYEHACTAWYIRYRTSGSVSFPRFLRVWTKDWKQNTHKKNQELISNYKDRVD